MDPKFLEAVRAGFPTENAIVLGAPMRDGEIEPEPLVRVPLGMLNRHGLIAGATGTGKTRTLQLVAEQLSAAGVSVFVADIKGDLSGLAVPGTAHPKIDERAAATGQAWQPTGFPLEFLSLTGKLGAQLRATVSSFGPLMLAKVLGLNDTQTSVLTMVFRYCDDKQFLLLDMSDLRTVLQYLRDEGAAELESYGGMSKQTVGVLLREMIELEAQGAEQFFGEPEFHLDDLMQVDRDGRGVISVLALSDCQDKPALFSTFMMWMLARLYLDLPEVGDPVKPKLVFFLDEAHLLFDGASTAFTKEVEQVVRLIRSKGVGIIFVTQSPKDIPADVLGQLGNRIQHALRAFTPDDEKAMRAAARTFPKTPWYDIEELLTTVGTGEAIVTVLTSKGEPTMPVATHLIAPSASMTPLTDDELQRRIGVSPQVKRYRDTLDRQSAREVIEARLHSAAAAAPIGVEDTPATRSRRHGSQSESRSALEKLLKTRTASNMGTQFVRSAMGALLQLMKQKR
ncbi:MAG: helicase HerA-like domain-containing protein [Gemmatimonadota bacterium]